MNPRRPRPAPAGRRITRRSDGVRRIHPILAVLVWAVGPVVAALAVPAIAEGMTGLATASLNQVITNLRNVVVGLLVGLATLFFTIGGVRYMLAGGDPSEVEAAKKTLRYGAIGYGVAILAPGLVQLLQRIVGA